MTTGNKTALLLAALLSVALCTAGAAEAGKPTVGGSCQKCHTAEPNAVRGNIGKVSPEFSTLQVSVGSMVWIVKYDDKTSVIDGDKTSGADTIKNIAKDKEILVNFSGDESKPLATEVTIKQPFKVAENQMISNDEVVKLVSMGPEQGKYTLVDARPAGAFISGHIPTAVSLPFDTFQDNCATILPGDKERLLVFYCGGPT